MGGVGPSIILVTFVRAQGSPGAVPNRFRFRSQLKEAVKRDAGNAQNAENADTMLIFDGWRRTRRYA